MFSHYLDRYDVRFVLKFGILELKNNFFNETKTADIKKFENV